MRCYVLIADHKRCINSIIYTVYTVLSGLSKKKKILIYGRDLAKVLECSEKCDQEGQYIALRMRMGKYLPEVSSVFSTVFVFGCCCLPYLSSELVVSLHLNQLRNFPAKTDQSEKKHILPSHSALEGNMLFPDL